MDNFFRFQRNLKLPGGLWGFPSNALGTQLYNFEMLDFIYEFFASWKTRNVFLFVLQSREISNSVAFPEILRMLGLFTSNALRTHTYNFLIN